MAVSLIDAPRRPSNGKDELGSLDSRVDDARGIAHPSPEGFSIRWADTSGCALGCWGFPGQSRGCLTVRTCRFYIIHQGTRWLVERAPCSSGVCTGLLHLGCAALSG